MSVPNNNAAGRLLWLMKRSHEVAVGRLGSAAGDVWPVVFDTGEGMAIAGDPEVARLLILASEQVEFVQKALHARSVPEPAYAKHLNSVRHALSLRHLQAPWQDVAVRSFSEPVVVCVEMAAGLLDHINEPAISAEQMDELRKIIKEFREAVHAATDLPSIVMAFLLRQLALLEGALRAYQIAGSKAFQDAADRAAADFIAHAPSLAPHAQTKAVISWLRSWPQLAKICGTVAIVSHGLGSMLTTADRMANVLNAYHVMPARVEHFLAPLVATEAGAHPATTQIDGAKQAAIPATTSASH